VVSGVRKISISENKIFTFTSKKEKGYTLTSIILHLLTRKKIISLSWSYEHRHAKKLFETQKNKTFLNSKKCLLQKSKSNRVPSKKKTENLNFFSPSLPFHTCNISFIFLRSSKRSIRRKSDDVLLRLISTKIALIALTLCHDRLNRYRDL